MANMIKEKDKIKAMVQSGAIYRHYKNRQLYQVVGIAYHSDTKECYVVYKGLYTSGEFGNEPLFIRIVDVFLETIMQEGKEVARFELLHDR
jgi:hypothetical protein